MLSCLPTDPHKQHHSTCGCLDFSANTQRRGLLTLAGAGLVSALLGGKASAASGDYDAMLVNCIDPRFTTSSMRYMQTNNMQDRYSHFVIAGGPIGAIHSRFAGWHTAFWDNLDVTVQLHNIKRVVALTHRDCGAAKLAFGEAAVSNRTAETTSHAESLRAFQAEMKRRKPALAVACGIMDLNGSVEAVT